MTKEFQRFLITGGIATLSHYVVFWLWISLNKDEATIASAIGYLFGAVVSYLLNYYYTFDSKRSHSGTIARFYLMALAGFFINVGIVHGLATSLALNPWLSQVCATGLVFFWNFIVSKIFVFEGKR